MGAVALPNKFMRDLPDTISVSSTVPQVELFEHYRAADILAFPTLCDGFGMRAAFRIVAPTVALGKLWAFVGKKQKAR